MSIQILVVDDEPDFLDSARRMLCIAGFDQVTTLAESPKVLPLLETTRFDVAFLDITMPGLDGLELLRLIKEQSPATECIMITANESVPTVVRAIRLGAYDYLVKPLVPEQLEYALSRALERRSLVEALRLRSERAPHPALANPHAFEAIVSEDSQVQRLLREAELHAISDVPVLITGETGVGKELLAQAVHKASRRAKGPFVAVNMLAVSPNLFESEFFGHARGAFTGADRDRAGLLAQANGGTLFLDEIGDLPIEIQGKLLRILQEREYLPVGKTRPERVDLRFIAATNQDLGRLVEQRRFRRDLLYRLQVANLHLSALRDRPEDIPLLATSFLKDSGTTLAPESIEALCAHDWPGNVRELKGAIDAARNLATGGVIGREHLRLPTRVSPRAAPVATGVGTTVEPLEAVERRHILTTYAALGHNKSQTARALEIGLQTLHRKLKSYGVD